MHIRALYGAIVYRWMRSACARALVRIAAGWMDTWYNVYVRRELYGNIPNWFENGLVIIGRPISLNAQRLAIKLDSETAGEQMANEGWWG